jgi:hypothetical protein
MEIKFVCACGEEVSEDGIKKIYRAENGILRAAEDIKAGDMLMIEDRPLNLSGVVHVWERGLV